MTKPAVVLIGADKGGVGKTTVARTLLDHFAHHQVCARAFDTEVPKGTLKRFHPDMTDILDINHVPDQTHAGITLNIGLLRSFTGKLNKLTPEIDRPKLTPEDEKRLRETQRNNRASE